MKRHEVDGQSGGDPHELWYRFDGRQMGHVGNNGTADLSYVASIADRTVAQGTGAFRHGATTMTARAEFGPNLEQISSYNQGAAGGIRTSRRRRPANE
ncbi:MAG: hypothetical protein ACT4N8_03130 [Sphingosinicella sp.]|uniref:hypothetical protein n=1 Tax=Sphingosinicella sp. TaxID=1917971 RepID=UPI0040377DA2